MKTYIVRATAQIQLTAKTDKPDDMETLVKSALMAVCDISADITDLSAEEINGGQKQCHLKNLSAIRLTIA